MDQSFGHLLRKYRQAAMLTQTGLGRKIHIDGSMISRFETGRVRPNASTLQQIINALALYGVPREELDQLWDAAGYYRSALLEGPVADPIVEFVHQELQRLDPEQRHLLGEDLRSIIEIHQEYFSAKEESATGRFERTVETLGSLRGLVERRFEDWYLRIDEELGWSNYNSGQYATAIRYYESAIWAARQLGNVRKVADILIKLGDVHRRRGGHHEWQIARDHYREARQIFEDELDDRLGIADCMRKTAGAYLYQGIPDKADQLVSQSLKISQMDDYARGIYKGLQHKAWARQLLGDWEEAARLCEEALSIVKTVASDDSEVAKGLRYLGDVYRLQRRFEDAEAAYKQALDILNKPHRDAGIAAKLLIGKVQLGLAQLYLRRRGRETSAKWYLQQSMDTHRALAEDFAIAQALSEQGELLLRVGRPEIAEGHLQTAASQFEKLGNTFHYAKALATLCLLYYSKGHSAFDKLYDIAEAARNADDGLIDYHLANIEFTVAKARMDEGAYPEAFRAFHVASTRALNFNDQTFCDVSSRISGEVDRTVRMAGPAVALQLCYSQMDYWEDGLQQLDPTLRELVRGSLKALEQKCAEVKALVAVQQ